MARADNPPMVLRRRKKKGNNVVNDCSARLRAGILLSPKEINNRDKKRLKLKTSCLGL
jgi:hypothetical protein